MAAAGLSATAARVVMPIGRLVSLVLVDDQAEVLGELAPFRVHRPWWRTQGWDPIHTPGSRAGGMSAAASTSTPQALVICQQGREARHASPMS